jgi:hypothetical protein
MQQNIILNVWHLIKSQEGKKLENTTYNKAKNQLFEMNPK